MAAPAYTYPATPTAIQAVASEGLFTAFELALGIPQVRRQLMSRHNMTKNFYNTLRELGLGAPLAGPEFFHYEEDWIINNFLVGSIVTASTGVGTNVVIALDSTSMYSTTIPGAGTVRFSYPAVYDVVKLHDDSEAVIIAKDVTTNPHRLTIRPKLTTQNLSGTLLAGSRYFMPSNGFGEGTYGASSKIPRVYKWTNNTQIIKSNYSETGSSLTNKMPFKNIPGKEGSYMIIGGEATELLQMNRISGALFFGKQADNITVTSDATGTTVPIKYTQGLDDFIEDNGNLLPYPAAGFDMASFDAMGEIFNRERIKSKNILMPMAYGLHAQINTLLKDFMDYTSFEYAASNSPFKSDILDSTDAKDFFLWLDFAGVRKNGYNFLMKHQYELDEVMGAGTPGYAWNRTGYAIPVETFRNADGSDGLIPTIGYRYKSLNGYNRENVVNYTGGAGAFNRATSTLDAMSMDLLFEGGGEFGLGNQMIKLTPE